MSRRVFRIRGEEGEEAPLKIVYRSVKRPEPSKAKPTDQELLFRLLDLRIRGEADGEAYFDLLREYLEKASRTGIDAERLREYAGKLEALGDGETLREVERILERVRLEAGRDG
jgi:hypothetical protein